MITITLSQEHAEEIANAVDYLPTTNSGVEMIIDEQLHNGTQLQLTEVQAEELASVMDYIPFWVDAVVTLDTALDNALNGA